MRSLAKHMSVVFAFPALWVLLSEPARAEVKAWEGTITIPTYPWEDDVNPKFWALEGGAGLSTTVKGSITYPYTMQDHLSRTKVDRTYKALFLENEYLKITCLPELGGRLHSVFDKTRGEETFHLNRVIKPGMIAMRGAFISGGVEWNAGPQVHTVTIVSPVDALIGRNDDGSAFLEVSNQEKILRTRWTVRVTLHPGKAYLDERIRIYNPTDGMHPYYFWNCTAFPNLPGTRFIYPMTLGTDHHGRKFFHWPIHEGRDLSWLKNHETWTSVFSVDCAYDFFGAYEVDADRGVVQVADHHRLPGKKAWTWGNWEFGLASQRNLTDDDGPYIEVQSGPLPTQSDYGMLGPREVISWREWWYPVHGLGDGFEYATRDVAVQTFRDGGKLELRLAATGEFPAAACTLSQEGRVLLDKRIDLSPKGPQVIALSPAPPSPVEVIVKTAAGHVLASFTTPLPIPKVTPPDPAKFEEKPDEELTVEQRYFKGRKFDRATDRLSARKYYEMALADDPGHVASLRALAVLDVEAALYRAAIERLQKALDRDSDDGLSWYFLGVCHLRLRNEIEALRCGYRATKCFGTVALGYDLAGRARMRLKNYPEAIAAFGSAARHNPTDRQTQSHLQLALYAAGRREEAFGRAKRTLARVPTDLVAGALLALQSDSEMARFAEEARAFVGEDEFEMLETGLTFAELGLVDEAGRLLRATCVDAISEDRRSPLPLYYLAYYASLRGDEPSAEAYLRQAAAIRRDFIFASRPEAVDVLGYAVAKNPGDAGGHLHLGNLFANLGRLDEAVSHWQRAAELDSSLSIAWRNLGLAVLARAGDLPKAAGLYRKAIAARPQDQTLHRDLAEILLGAGKRPEAIGVLEAMPLEGMRRSEITIMLARAYLDEQRHSDTIELLDATPYFVNWEGQTITWTLFNRSHVARGRKRLEAKDFAGALADFEAALTYPENIGVGRSNTPEEAPAQYWRGKALEALGRLDEARSAWKAGAAGAEGSAEQNEYRGMCKEALATAR